ncbi:hypothetical protein RI367_006027 [Sorochytrium milnesiophthora]
MIWRGLPCGAVKALGRRHTHQVQQTIDDSVQALPFRLKPKQALESYEKYHSYNRLLVRPDFEHMTRAFVPYWMVEMRGVVKVPRSVEVGYQRYQTKVNSQTGKPEKVRRMEWRFVAPPEPAAYRFGVDEPTSKLVLAQQAGMWRDNYGPKFISNLPRQPLTSLAEAWPKQPNDQVGLQLKPFEMNAQEALQQGVEIVRDRARYRLEQDIKTKYSADAVRSLEVTVTSEAYRLTPVFVPMYEAQGAVWLFRRVTFPTAISGFNGDVSGTRVYDPSAIAAVVAGGGSLLAAAVAVLNDRSWTEVVSPYLHWPLVVVPIGMVLLPSYGPVLLHAFRQWMRQRSVSTALYSLRDMGWVKRHQQGEL